MNEKELKVERVCNKCGEVNELKHRNVYKKDCYTETGEFVRVIYSKCERCGEIDVLQVDSMQTIRIFNDYKKLLLNAIRKRQRGDSVSKKEDKKQKKLSESLKLKRNELAERCNGINLYDKNKNLFVKSLTLKKVGDIIDSDM